MIINEEKINDCVPVIKAVVNQIHLWALTKGIKQMVISSGRRTAQENSDVGGSSTSLHLSGRAVDFYFNNVNMFKVVTPLFLDYLNNIGGWAGTTEFEVCRANDNLQHIHVGTSDIDYKKSFTGVYK